MVLNLKQRQKRIENKNKKRKLAKRSLGASFLARDNASGYSGFPIHECFVPSTLFETGIGYVIVTRRTPNGIIATSVFVVDVYCLGVKNALFNVSSEMEYENTIKPRLMESGEEQQFENIHPACARNLVEGAVLYAKELGFPPHSDYKYAKGIFGDLDINSCPVKYSYGKNDKPFYIRGPNESIVQAKQIINQLNKTCGEGNYDYLVMLDEGMIE